uniref:hypothetical protein n=1 Tax=Thiolapillus sp. TaxID=2017437 RepID=UPI0025F6DE49
MVCHNQSDYKIGVIYFFRGTYQACLRPRDRFWDIPVPKIDSAFDNLFVPQPSWSPSTTQQLRKLVAAPYLPPNNWTPRLDAYFASPLALCARRVSSAASRLLGLPAFASLSMAGSVGNARATQERRTALHPGIGCLEAMAFP